MVIFPSIRLLGFVFAMYTYIIIVIIIITSSSSSSSSSSSYIARVKQPSYVSSFEKGLHGYPQVFSPIPIQSC